MPLSFRLKLVVLGFGKNPVEVLHAIFEDLMLIFGQKSLLKSCRILNVYESGHKICLIWTQDEQVRAILMKPVKNWQKHEKRQKYMNQVSNEKSASNKICKGLNELSIDTKNT